MVGANIGYIIFESMDATYVAISSSSPPDESKLRPPYGMLLTIIFAYFTAPVYYLESQKPGAISSTLEKLMQLDKLDASTSEP